MSQVRNDLEEQTTESMLSFPGQILSWSPIKNITQEAWWISICLLANLGQEILLPPVNFSSAGQSSLCSCQVLDNGISDIIYILQIAPETADTLVKEENFLRHSCPVTITCQLLCLDFFSPEYSWCFSHHRLHHSPVLVAVWWSGGYETWSLIGWS